MLNLIKKDFLTLSRNRSEILILLIMPSVLIVILGFSLGGMINNETSIQSVAIAFVNENDIEADLDAFMIEMIQKEIPQEIVDQMRMQAKAIDPATLFLQMLNTLQDEAIVTLTTTLSQTQAQEALQNNDVDAMITLPKGFTYNTLMSVINDKDSMGVIEVIVGDHDAISTTLLESVTKRFASEYNLHASVLIATEGMDVAINLPDSFGEVTHLPLLKSITSFQYYTLGMSMMFALHVASSIASNAFKEKSNHTFSRIMVTGEKPIRYLMSKAIAASLISLTQLTLLFTTSTLLFNTFGSLSTETLRGILIASVILALTIGSLSALLTAMSQRFNTDSVSGVFAMFVINIFSFLGGSMIPTQMFSPLLGRIGLWTPNGAMMNVYLQLMRGQAFNDVVPILTRVGMMMCVFMTLALIVFPKRRLV